MEEARADLEKQKTELKNLRKETGRNRKEFSEFFGIPLRTMEDWEAGRRKMPDYLLRLIAYKIHMEQMYQKKDTDGADRTRNISVIYDADGKKIVLINDIRFRGKKREEWDEVEKYLIQYVGSYYEIEESSDIIYISSDFPDEYANSAKAKANTAQGITEPMQIATNASYSDNMKKKYEKDAKLGWYRYDVRFALPVYDDKSGNLIQYHIFFARMLVRHAEDGKKYLYDLAVIKKETSSPLD